MKRALLYLFFFIFIQFFATWMVYIVWILISSGSLDELALVLKGGGNGITSGTLITASAVSSLVTIFFFLWLKWAKVSLTWIKRGNFDILFLSAIASIGTLIPSVWLQEIFPELPDSMENTFKLIMDNPYGYLMICLFAPLVEEIVFRGAILRALLDKIKHHWVAILISAVFFALVHGNPAQMPHAFLIGLLLGWMYFLSKSILPGVMLHWVNNTIAYVIYMLWPESIDEKLIDIFNGNNLYLLLSLVLSLLLLIVSIYSLNKRMKRR